MSFINRIMKHASLLSLAAALLAVQGITSPAIAATVAHEPAPGAAVFSSFTYEGNDDYYAQHPLTSDDQAYNPILPGWYSDPSICADGKGNYYLTTSTFGWYPGVPLFHSRDLMNWTQLGHVLNRPSQLPLEGQTMGKEGIYASSIFYNKYNDTYYMISTNMGLMTHYYRPGTFLVKAKDPKGPWSEPIYLQNMGGIDPSMFFDDNGKAYVLFCRMLNDEYPGRNKIILQEYDTKADTVKTETAMAIADRGAFPEQQPMCLEGPHLYKVNGMYYLLCAEGGTGDYHSEVVFRSHDIWGRYESYQGNPILTQRNLQPRRDGVYCTGHADIFQDAKGKWWSVFLGTRRLDSDFENLGRETFLLPMEWTADGWPVILKKGEEVPLTITIPGTKRGAQPTFGNFTQQETFDSKTLGPQWEMIRGDASRLYSLTEQRGKLVLRCSKATASTLDSIPAFIGRRLQHHQFTVTTTMHFTPMGNARAGLALMKSEDHQYFLAMRKADNGNALELLRIEPKGAVKQLAQQPIGKTTDVQLRVSSPTGRTFTFSYSLNGGKTWQVLCQGVDAKYLSTHAADGADGFTGTLIGMYATTGL